MALPNTQSCPQCFSTIDARCLVCPYCQQRIKGIQCQSCLMVCPLGASVCHHCNASFANAAIATAMESIPNRSFIANRLGNLLLNFSFIPTRAYTSPEKLVVTHYRLLGLVSSNEEIPWNKVAGFKHRSGILWDSISIETRGQSGAWISPLNKVDANALKTVLQRLER